MAQHIFRPFLVLFLIVGPWIPGNAAPPVNDNYPGAEAIIVLPYLLAMDISEATLQPQEPQHCSPSAGTIWYGFVPSGPVTLVADAFGSERTNISIYREAGDGATFADLEFMQCTSGGPVTVELVAGERYFIQAGSVAGADGIVEFSLSSMVGIAGRVIDAATGMPLSGFSWPFAWVSLSRVCGEGCQEHVGTLSADDEGRFRFENYIFGELVPGMYTLRAGAYLYTAVELGPFEFLGGNVDLGDLALELPPPIHSIRGRLLDRATGKPVPQTFSPMVLLYRCTDVDCWEFVDWKFLGRDGRFVFETDSFGNPLPAGRYVVTGAGTWYGGVSKEIEVKEGERRSIGDLRIRSAPIRFSDLQACPELPSTGGECLYSARIWNGLGSTFEGAAWGTAQAFLYDEVTGYTNFQIRDAQKLVLEPGQSRVVRFRLQIPEGKTQSEISLCVRIYVGRGGNPFFNTLGTEVPFCLLDTADGYRVVPPEQAGRRGEQTADLSASEAELEPNNSCETAQDLGSFPFTMDGNLDSSLSPDVDFFRFHGDPGAGVTIDMEGLPTGQGTLEEPLLGVFDSGCNLLQVLSAFANPTLTALLPPDGVLILAATASFDWSFVGGGHGTYQLRVAALEAVGSIRGSITDANTGTSLSGEAPFFASVYLIRCGALTCEFINSMPADADGRFSFDRDYNGVPLRAGDYKVSVFASQYQRVESSPVAVGAGEHLDLGTFALTPWPVQISELENCTFPSEGGVCEVSMKVTNTLSTRFSGKAWQMVFASSIGTPVDYTAFRAGPVVDLRLEPGASRTLHFRFRVPSRVPDRAFICSDAFVGQNPNAFFNPVGEASLFCLEKGAQGLTLMSPKDAHAALRQMQIQQLAPHPPFPKRLK